jgi:hypothetical protein
MKTKVKSKAPKAATGQLAKLRAQVDKNYKQSKDKEKHLITLDRECFRKELSSPAGFGAQDLKPTYFNLYMYVMKKFGSKLIVKLEDLSQMKIALYSK